MIRFMFSAIALKPVDRTAGEVQAVATTLSGGKNVTSSAFGNLCRPGRFSPLIGVMGVMSDKDHEGLLSAFEPHLAHLVCTQNSTSRALPASLLAEMAVEIYGEDRVTVVPRLADAIDQAAALAEAGEAFGDPLGSGAVLVTGSVVTAGEARTLLKGRER